MSDNPIEKLQDALRATVKWVESTGTPYVIIGGLAVGFLGRPRMTNDVEQLRSRLDHVTLSKVVTILTMTPDEIADDD